MDDLLIDICIQFRLDKEDYSKAEKRQKAVAFLDTPELLMMYAQTTGQVCFFLPLPFVVLVVIFVVCDGWLTGSVKHEIDHLRCETSLHEDALWV